MGSADHSAQPHPHEVPELCPDPPWSLRSSTSSPKPRAMPSSMVVTPLIIMRHPQGKDTLKREHRRSGFIEPHPNAFPGSNARSSRAHPNKVFLRVHTLPPVPPHEPVILVPCLLWSYATVKASFCSEPAFHTSRLPLLPS